MTEVTIIDPMTTDEARAHVDAINAHVLDIGAAVNHYGEKPTPSEMRRAAEVITEAVMTGHVDIGDGTSTPINAALTVQDYEAAMRQKQHIADKRGALVWRGDILVVPQNGVFICRARGDDDFSELWQLQRDGKKLTAVIYEQIEG